MEVTVTPEDLDGVIFDGSMIIATGTNGNTRVTFAGDARMMRSFLHAVAESGVEQVAWVEDYQITSQRPIAAQKRA
jgi:hypothetical protein